MIKVSLVRASGEHGACVLPLFGPADAHFEKVAAPSLLGEVSRYIATLRPRNDSQYELVCAMGAGEYYGSNVNGDHFSEAGLIHRPDDWSGNPLVDAIKAKDWPYGFPTFYSAQVYAHHRNKDPSRGFGAVELAAYNPEMKRVELVCRLDRDRCRAFGGQAVWDRLKAGEFPDVSMGTKVPFDLCSACGDTAVYEEAQARFDPARHKTPADAILEVHKQKKERDGVGIRGLSVTRRDYCEHARAMMNKILPDGRKVWVYNDFPRFFDISFVFIGADKIAKSMMKIAHEGRRWLLPSSPVLVQAPRPREPESPRTGEKTASHGVGTAAFKSAGAKQSAITKDVVPSQFAGRAVPVLTRTEPPLSPELTRVLGSFPLEHALSTLSALGIVLRPTEFQRVVLIERGSADLAEKLDELGLVFPKGEAAGSMTLSGAGFHPVLARLLSPILSERSAFGPIIEARALMAEGAPERSEETRVVHSSPLLRKVGALYTAYRAALIPAMEKAPSVLEKIAEPRDAWLRDLLGVERGALLTPLSIAYVIEAFRD